jgi:hypothetical protein
MIIKDSLPSLRLRKRYYGEVGGALDRHAIETPPRKLTLQNLQFSLPIYSNKIIMWSLYILQSFDGSFYVILQPLLVVYMGVVIFIGSIWGHYDVYW